MPCTRNDTELVDYISHFAAKGHNIAIARNGKTMTVNLFNRVGYGDNVRDALDDLIEKMNATVSERVARRLSE